MIKEKIIIGETNADIFICTPLRTPGTRLPVIRASKSSTFQNR